MESNLLVRAAGDFAVSERIIEGVAHAWDAPTRVTDDGRNFYMEAFTRGSSTKTIAETRAVPLGYFHPWQPNSPGSKSRFAGETFGAVTFEESSEGLVFRAKVSETTTGDEMLALLNDGAVGDVSLGYFSEKSVTRGDVRVRTEIRHWELSLAPTGMAQDSSSRITAVRSQIQVPRRRRLPLQIW